MIAINWTDFRTKNHHQQQFSSSSQTVLWILNKQKITWSFTDDIPEFSTQPVDPIQVNWVHFKLLWGLPQLNCLFFDRFSLVFLLDQFFSSFFHLVGQKIEVDHIRIFVLHLADYAFLATALLLDIWRFGAFRTFIFFLGHNLFDFLFEFDFLESLSGHDVATCPQPNETIEPVIFEFGDGASNIVKTVGRCSLDLDLN